MGKSFLLQLLIDEFLLSKLFVISLQWLLCSFRPPLCIVPITPLFLEAILCSKQLSLPLLRWAVIGMILRYIPSWFNSEITNHATINPVLENVSHKLCRGHTVSTGNDLGALECKVLGWGSETTSAAANEFLVFLFTGDFCLHKTGEWNKCQN